MKIDFHTHIIPEKLPDMAGRYGGERWPTVERTCPGGANIMVGGKVFREITDQCWDPLKRIPDMDAEGVDKQVVSPVPVTFSYFAPAEAALEFSRFQNDFIAQTVSSHPARFIGLGTVPLQSPEAAIEEMDRIIHGLKLSGLELGTNVSGKNLDDAELLPFFAKAAEWNVPLFIHPWEVLGRERLSRHNFTYTVGMPAETALAAASLIWGGVLEKFPSLRICLAHGGGSLPYILPRLDHAWELMEAARLTPRRPSDYARQLYFDSLVYDPGNIRYLVERFGADRVLLGTDYPFLIRETPAGKVLEEVESVTEAERRLMRGENALRFLSPRDGRESSV